MTTKITNFSWRLLICFAIALMPYYAAAKDSNKMSQERVQVSGIVRSSDGVALAGVSIFEKGTSNGTTTSAEGRFSLQVKANSTLQISIIGYGTEEEVLGSENVDNLLVMMTTEDKLLQEVMVVGYGTRSKDLFAGSAVTLTPEDLNKSSVSIANMLQGRAAGVQVSQNNGTPGAGLSIRIRGTNSINADSEPLYVIDGFPTSDGVGLSVKPEDIESITVLKDAASASIYGARGANGVVLITTKKGIDKPSRVNVNSSVGYQNVVD